MNPNVRKLEAQLKRRYGTRYRKGRGKNGLEYKICCPFCLKRVGKEDRKFKLYLNPEIDRANCFRCGYKGRVSDIFGDMRMAEDAPFVRLPPTPLPTDVPPPGTLHMLSELPNDHVCLNYLRGRGLRPAVLEQYYGVRYCSEGRDFAGVFNTTNTVVFPIWMNQQLVGWQSRLLYTPDKLTEAECAALGYKLDDDGLHIRPPKYFTAPGMDKGRVMFNYDLARQSEVVVICEGPTDAIATGPCAVATLGKGVAEHQSRLIKSYWKLAVTLLDPGDAEREMQALYGNLYTTMPVVKVSLRGYKDAGEATTLEIWSQIYDAAQAAGIDLQQYDLGPYMSKDIFKL